MCLITNNKIPLVAKKNITCYKIIKLDSTDKKVWHPIFQNGTYKYGKIINVEPYKIEKNYINNYDVGKGFFHAYTTKYSALLTLATFYNHNYYNYKIVECIIPKDTLYFVNNKDNAICSRIMIVHKSLHPNVFKRIYNVLKGNYIEL